MKISTNLTPIKRFFREYSDYALTKKFVITLGIQITVGDDYTQETTP